MRDWSHTSSIARRLLWWRRSLHRSPDDRVRGGDPFIDRRTIVFAEAIPSSIAGRSCSRRRSLHRSPDDRVRGGDLFIDRRTIVFAEAISSSIAGRSCSRRRSLHRSPDDRVRGGDPFIDRRTIVFAEAISSSIAGRSLSRNGHDTGIPFANPGDTLVSLTISSVQIDGLSLGAPSSNLVLQPRAHTAKFIREF